ncbi:MAG TPA: permease [bacterium]|uniref:Putative permease n=1 Tax=candidate division TA06 bacterium ADurb.Bin417 TaxID=1852828 RepID=A0A1V5MKW2_UNCT6|nr:MAG: putative permease [candidate division TA06 bacterium ADurb.Bin417]HNQ34632.1 permease [bacterium]HNS48305.1 permease [bacterium]
MKTRLSEPAKLLLMLSLFLFSFYLPVDWLPFRNPVYEAFALLKWYAREHVLLCLVPAFFIAGAISVFVSQAAVLKYFGGRANKWLAYGVASVSGSVLAVCSCTVLPLFSGIYRRGAGLGPATAFLYSGPAINVLAIIMTARILGWRLGLARAVGAVLFSVVIGLLMHLIFLKEEQHRHQAGDLFTGDETERRSLRQETLYFAALVGILVFANWSKPPAAGLGPWAVVFQLKWFITGLLGLALLAMLKAWFAKEELTGWIQAAWTFAKQIFPLLLAGVLVSGLLLGRPGHEGLIPSRFVAALVGGNSFFANLFASIVAAFMYFATLTEVPILQGLIGSGMGQGPALALLLAGPALSLPSMLVLRSVLGTKKTVVYVLLVIGLSTLAGMLFGALAG